MRVTTTILLKRRVQRSALALNNGDRDFLWRQNFDQTKIDKLDQALRHEFQVAGFKIPVHNRWILHVQECEGIRDLFCPCQHFLFGQEFFMSASLHHQCAQVTAWHIIHYEVVAGTMREEIRDLWQVGVIETRKHSSLAQELLAGFISNFFREGTVVLNFLQRAFTTLEAGIIGQINGTHSALTDPFTDLVAPAQDLPAFEGWQHHSPFGTPLALRASDSFVSALVLHRNACLCYIIYYTASWIIHKLETVILRRALRAFFARHAMTNCLLRTS